MFVEIAKRVFWFLTVTLKIMYSYDGNLVQTFSNSVREITYSLIIKVHESIQKPTILTVRI